MIIFSFGIAFKKEKELSRKIIFSYIILLLPELYDL